MSESQNIPWKRITVEAAAIVASILLAFAIDAWWDQRIEQKRSLAQLETIRTEFLEVQEQLYRREKQLIGLREAVSKFLTHIGPDSPLQPLESLTALIDLSFRAARIEVPTVSLQASDGLSNISSNELKKLLAAWPAEVSRLGNQSGLLEANREEIIRYLHAKIPTLAIAYQTNEMNDYPQSSFVGDPEVLQRDMKVEGLFGNRGMMIEDTLDRVSDLKNHVASSIELIEIELSK